MYCELYLPDQTRKAPVYLSHPGGEDAQPKEESMWTNLDVTQVQ